MIVRPPKKRKKYREPRSSKNFKNIDSTFDTFFKFNSRGATRITKEQRRLKSQSQGEQKIEKWLLENEIKYKPEKNFKDLINPKTGMNLRFDFYLPKHKMCIEFDGLQHFKDCEKFDADGKDSLEARIYRDEVKNDYCARKKFKLIRIRYSQISLIPHILKTNIAC